MAKTHGHRSARRGLQSRTYISWRAMKQRCQNPRHQRYEDYGGRGIFFDPRWASFAVFLREMGERPTKKHSLDRINVNGPYRKENCRWATQRMQALNKRIEGWD